MTAQKLAGSSTTDSYQAFKQALEHKVNSERLYRREKEAMPIPEDTPHQQEQAQTSTSILAMTASQPQRETKNLKTHVLDDQLRIQQSQKTKEEEAQRHQQLEHQHAMVIVADDVAAPATSGSDADSAAGTRAAIPVSPPSSPTHVGPVASTQKDEGVSAADKATAPLEASPSTTEEGPANTTGSAAAVPVEAPVVPVRLGRGRKLCPNCKALTKSAVKQCRECQHVFNPVSARLRAQQQQLQPKENEAPPLPRRRHRPSQRLRESRVESLAADAAASASATIPSSTRRPLAASNSTAADGDRSHPLSDAAPTNKTQQQQQQQTPKRSHKRKVPLPPGVSPPKRRKGAAATARLAATKTAATAAAAAAAAPPTAHTTRILPVLSLPEQQRLADLLASPAPARHVLVPDSPELAPMASPAGPLWFEPSASSCSAWSASSSLGDGQDWLSRGSDSGVNGGGAGVVTPASFARQPRQQRDLYPHQLAAAAQEGLSPEGEGKQEQQQQQQIGRAFRRQEYGGGGARSAPSTDAHERDPFAGVEMTWWEGGENPTACAPTYFQLAGKDEQRGGFPWTQNTELLGDTDDAFLWTPPGASSANETLLGSGGGSGSSSNGGGARTVAASSLTLWPGSSNNDSNVLMSAAQSASVAESHIPGPEKVVSPTFAGGAAIASSLTGAAKAIDSPVERAGEIYGSETTAGATAHPELLLPDSSCSSLPGLLILGDTSGSWSAGAAAVTADSGDGDDQEALWSAA